MKYTISSKNLKSVPEIMHSDNNESISNFVTLDVVELFWTAPLFASAAAVWSPQWNIQRSLL